MTKSITLALAMIGLSSVALAGAPGNNMVVPTGTPVIAPDSTGTWSFGLEALYMESNTNFQYATIDTSPTTDVVDQDNQSVSNDWNWGGEVDVSYIFPGSSRDVSASYTYLNQDGSDSVGGDTGLDNVHGPLLTGLGSDEAEADVDQTLNAATLTFGQLLTVGDRLSLHPFGGLQFASIDTTNKATYEETEAGVEGVTASYKGDSDFEGIGPRAGIDASVHLGNNFSVVGTFAGALLVGNMDSHFDIDATAIPVDADFDNDSYTAVVPELDAKLGLDYMHAFNPNTSMDIQVGYQVVNYFNAESNDFGDSVFANSVNNTSDFNYNGPYLRLQLNVA
ncbi:MAG: hypothetical protein K2Q14_01105 [Gammaproteobacteria bacterium]|nr:hypothetical protein [Gammaproteobacteria bacterium]